MKRVLLLVAAIILFGCMSVMAMPVGVERDPNTTAFVFAVGYQEAVQIDAGLAIPISTGLYTFVSAMGGDYGIGLGGRLAYTLTMNNVTNIWVGLAGGFDSEWHNIPEDDIGPVNYISGATGVLIGYSFDGWGLFGLFERNFPKNYTGYLSVYFDL